MQWYEKAAALGNTEAMRNLGLLYAKGEGVNQYRRRKTSASITINSYGRA
jgi:TPR repeat protein